MLESAAVQGPIMLTASRCQPPRDDVVYGGIKGQADMGSRNFEIDGGVLGDAIVPVDHAVASRVDGRLADAGRQIAAQGVQELASAAAGVAIRQNSRAMLHQDPFAN